MICGCLRKKLNELPELIFPLVILTISVILLIIGIIINAVLTHYHNLGDALIIIGGLFTFFVGACLCSVWDGKYRIKKKSIRVLPINQVNVQTAKHYIQPSHSISRQIIIIDNLS